MQDKVSLPRVSTTLHTAAAAAEGGGGAGGAKKASGADDASARLRPALATFAAAVRGTDGALLAGGAGVAFRCAVGGGGGFKQWPRHGPNDGTNWTGVGGTPRHWLWGVRRALRPPGPSSTPHPPRARMPLASWHHLFSPLAPLVGVV